jgi:hypothetical protein
MSLFAAVLLAAAAASAQPIPPAPALGPFDLAGSVETALSFAASTPLQRPTGLRRADYLDTINRTLQYWRTQQAANGSIIDPATGAEEQYSTPHFSFAAALLVQQGVDPSLLEPAALALDFSTASMANGSNACAQATCDFYAVPVMQAYDILLPLVEASRAEMWTARLQGLDPSKT